MAIVIFVMAAALATGATAQQPSSTSPGPSSTASGDRVATPTRPARVVVEGCVVRQREVKGRASDVGERIGFNEHFVLFAAKVLEGKALAVAAPASGPAIYRIGGLTDEQLEVHVVRRVHIDGTFGGIDRGATPADSKHEDVLELTVATIRQVPGDCSIPGS